MSHLTALRHASNLHDLAYLLGSSPKGLAYILYKQPDSQKYVTFDIPKRSGGTRQINAPTERLKRVQRSVSRLLLECLSELYEKDERRDDFVHGFRRGRSIITNASAHRNRRTVFNLDLENFFGAINFGRVRGFFMKDRNFQLAPHVATVLAKIACHDNALPQGSPCSPVVSNLIARSLDLRLVAYAKRHGLRYSRYADDITFSTRAWILPAEIADNSTSGNTHAWALGAPLRQAVAKAGFAVNSTKTRVQYRGSRQEVTGLVVNQRVNVRQEYRRLVRAMTHRLTMMGSFDVPAWVGGGGASSRSSIDRLQGMLGFINSVDDAARRPAKLKPKGKQANGDSLSAQQKLYQKFLFYREFFAVDRPVVVCEGKTDSLYISLALRSLARSYPRLVTLDSTGKADLHIRFYRHHAKSKHGTAKPERAQKSTSTLMGLSGGGPALAGFLRAYVRESSKFKAPGGGYPLLIVVDNDTGADRVFTAVKELTKASKEIDGSKPFYRVGHQVYVVPVPKQDGRKETTIEDLFDVTLLETKLAGKSFHPSDDAFDPSKHYGKSAFATHIVQRRASEIDFKRFAPLLDAIDRAIVSHGVSP